MKNHPYVSIPAYASWRKAVSSTSMEDVDPVAFSRFRLSADDKIAAAGSCFAQHIARHLQLHDFNFYITEPAHPMVTSEIAAEFNYGTYTARYGNIYTARQLWQLFQRAYGCFSPEEDVWEEPDGSLIDPFRPGIQPAGFSSIEEYRVDRSKHFSAVREAFENLDAFIFTLGLTEAWSSAVDGSVYPLCPGVSGGSFDREKHKFQNFSVEEITSDLRAFIDGLKAINSSAKIIVTVSPVPLVATYENKHILSSTTYSKSVLRVACEELERDIQDVCYFPSYEIITGNYTRGKYFAEDLRSVTEEGVAHVMRIFMRHFTDRSTHGVSNESKADSHLEKMAKLVEVNCDEEALG